VFIEDFSNVYPIKIVVDCKLYTSKVDIKDVESTWMLVNDVRANLGIIICNTGYTEGAIKRAKDIGLLKLCLPIDSRHENFSTKLSMPVIAQKHKLEYNIEIYPENIAHIMYQSEAEEIFLKNIKTSKIAQIHEFILGNLEITEGTLNTENTIEFLNKEYSLYINNKRRRFSRISVRYSFFSKWVICSVPIKDGIGIFEVLEADKEHVNGQLLLGSQIDVDYNTEELQYYKQRDFDLKKDFTSYLMTDFEAIPDFLEVREYFSQVLTVVPPHLRSKR
jgi:hypothetical protein